ncbi:uncharacterized protein LOC121855801 [Homarus americanus]|uniref:uncharacterized protein LOC121855801 n=1 Tax=Homarus americanus TaxID=6706 RepID=UPI001C437A37|nr:uncharacterized protein LOC121855801 [Homarus americanus]XP_042206843.1 uncharacterized protein LOC121855801 [Homarus americanus]XP_042206845.1 uncharacterized protein LOC121855801 [Homarus americanus]XP_042206846.1 uncharacterized protein LOC121855801 [Homarus americanus]XP_042206847.1 uncharacterized protein LOC121855801 [Homarus americanus]XP_042206848.1 uncharacterized protein LOC121855801 [Homarus americanus]XP_042206849.1 uncharacterized protein LOC121855801 [Homarus americanus]
MNMSATPPPARRRVEVTVRRAQSERRYLSPWQASTTPRATLPHPTTFLHHHAPRTAIIPHVHPCPQHHPPRVAGQSRFMDLWGSMRYRPLPPVTRAQLPPLALGSPPLTLGSPLALGSPPIMLGQPPMVMPAMTLEDRLAQDRLSAYLVGETPPHTPRSILTCPESPLYESLISCFSDQEDVMTFPDTEIEHEYQQIQVVNGVPEETLQEEEVTVSCSSIQDDNQEHREAKAGNDVCSQSPVCQQQQGKTVPRKLNTLDVRPEKHHNKETEGTEDVSCTISSVSARSEDTSGSPLPKTTRSSSQSLSSSSHESHKSAIYITNNNPGNYDPDVDNSSGITVSDMYSETSRPPTVIHVSSTNNKSLVDHHSSHDTENRVDRKTSVKSNSSFSTSEDNYQVPSQTNYTSSSGSSKINLKANHSVKGSRDSVSDPAGKVQVMVRTKPPEVVRPPLTIELPETKEPGRGPWSPDHHTRCRTNKSGQACCFSSAPHIITTLDPPIRLARPASRPYSDNKTFRHNTMTAPHPNYIPPLVVNFDSEYSDTDDDSDTSTTSTLNDSTSLYLTEGDSSSIYSSVAEIYSVLTTDPESLVYVYRPPPRRYGYFQHRDSLTYRFPSYVLARSGNNNGGGSSGGSRRVVIGVVVGWLWRRLWGVIRGALLWTHRVFRGAHLPPFQLVGGLSWPPQDRLLVVMEQTGRLREDDQPTGGNYWALRRTSTTHLALPWETWLKGGLSLPHPLPPLHPLPSPLSPLPISLPSLIPSPPSSSSLLPLSYSLT